MPFRKFTPTDEQRADVELMACANVPKERMAAIMINPNTGRPVRVETLLKVFKEQLDNAKTRLQKKVLSAFIKKLDDGHWPAIEFAMRYCLGLDVGGRPNGGVLLSAQEHGIRLEFITPDPKLHADDPVPVGGSYDPRAPRPISKREMYNEANTTFPHRIEAEAKKG